MFALWDILFPLLFAGQSTAEAALKPLWLPYFAVGLLVNLLMTLGIITLYAQSCDPAGRIGLLGFVISLFGLLLFNGLTWSNAFVAPLLAAADPALLSPGAAGGALFNYGVALVFLTVGLGLMLLGWAFWRSGRYRPPGPILLMAGGLLTLLIKLLPIPFGAALLTGLAVAIMGFERE